MFWLILYSDICMRKLKYLIGQTTFLLETFATESKRQITCQRVRWVYCSDVMSAISE